ncbi:hypothetical protein [Streptomyces nitrosporeus]|uniref:hypothetical protein n=1 Tax=Streptomyces nitrosporeus TaxID=28894 RepID=UPI00331EC2AA
MKSFTAVTRKGRKFYSKVRYLGLAASAAMFGVGVFLAVVPGNGGEPLLNRSIVGGTLSVTIAWLAWVVAVRPQVVLCDESVKVRNWVTESVVPYGWVAGVDVRNGLVFELKDGSRIRGRVVGSSLVGQFAGYPSAKLIRREIQPLLGGDEAGGGEGVGERFSLSLKVPLVVAGLHVLLYGFTGHVLHLP